MTPENDQIYADRIEDALLFLSLYDPSVGIPNPRFFDGSVFGWRSQVQEMTNKFLARGNMAIDAVAMTLKKISGTFIFHPDDTRKRVSKYNYIGGRELSYEEKKRRLAFGRLKKMYYDENKRDTVFSEIDLDPFRNRIVEIRSIYVAPDGRAEQAVNDLMYLHQGRWQPLKDYGVDFSTAFSLSVMATWSNKVFWSVAFRLAPEAPSARFFTDPTGIKDFLRFRDIPEGKTRRTALANWVTQHWRQDRHDPEMEIYVREHLRGATRCHWHQMDVDIHIPEVERLREDQAIGQRRHRVDLGKHRRRRRK